MNINESRSGSRGGCEGFHCCNAKAGSFAIGVAEIILSSLGIWVLFWAVLTTVQRSLGHENTAAPLIVLGALIISLEIQFVAGVILIGAVQQGNAGKIKIWQVIQWVYVMCGTVLLVLLVAAGNVIEALQAAGALLIAIGSIWINQNQNQTKEQIAN